jgi:RNA polymerase sigma factor (sigma-70 family)
MTTVTLSDTLTARIASISAKYGPLAEDVAGHVTLTLLTLLADPKFASQAIGYHVRRAKWEAQKYVKAGATYNKHVDVEPQVLDDEGNEAFFFEEFVADAKADVEAQVVANEFERDMHIALSGLPEQQKKVARLMLDGYSNGEIAQALGVSKGRISQLADAMQKRMKEALAVYA